MRFTAYTDEHDDDPINVTTMVDVVFILLAFFVLTSQFLSPERDVALGHEQRAKTAGASAEDLPDSVLVTLEPTDAGGARIRIGRQQLEENNYAQLTGVLREIDLPTATVVIAAHPAMSVEQVAAAIDAVLASPMQKLSLSRLATGEGGA